MNPRLSWLPDAKRQDFDKEIRNWAVEIAMRSDLRKVWPDFYVISARFFIDPSQYAANEIVLSYLDLCAARLAKGRIALNGKNRRLLFNMIARLETRKQELNHHDK